MSFLKKSLIPLLLFFLAVQGSTDISAQTGSEDSLEIVAKKSFFQKKGKRVKKDLPEAKTFQIPESIEVTRGNPYTLKGIFTAKMEGKGKGKRKRGNIKCTYAHLNRFRGAVSYFFAKLFGQNPSNEIPLLSCNKNFKPGDEALAKKFSLQLESGLWFYRPGGEAKIKIEFRDVQPPDLVDVPQLVGLTRSEAENSLQSIGLLLGNITETYSDRPVNEVLSQDPSAGSKVQLGSSVNLEVSLGPSTATVPQLIGLTQAEAEAAITGARLSVGVILELFNPTVPAGLVTDQSPLSGSSLVLGSAVNFTVSKGVEQVSVPNLVGLSREAAEQALTEARLNVGTIAETYSDFPVNEVLAQDPTMDVSVDVGSGVDIEVSLGKQMVLVPQLVGLSQADAQTQIANAELSLGSVTQVFSNASIGQVTAQTPAAGLSVEVSTQVNLSVSKGPDYVQVPALTGINEDEARDLIIQAGLTAEIGYESSSTIPEGQIISQDPSANTQAVRGSVLNLVVSSGPPAGFVGGDDTITPEPAALYEQRDACIADNPISAPDLPPGREASFYEQVSFIFTGSSPMQEGVIAGTLNEDRLSVIMGYLRRANGDPISGAKVSFPKKPEYGETLTGACGEYYLAVNANELLTIEYSLAGFLTAQRQIRAQKGIFDSLDDVVLKPLDPNVTSVDLRGISEITVAEGSLIKDDRGARQAAIAFTPGTFATAKYPDGSQADLANINVRITEFTVGDSGPESMPAELPANTGYTYAAEFSIDEAISAEIVEFSKPAFLMLDNFVGVPDGSVVPVGYYSRTESRWIPELDGFAFSIINFENEKAVVDFNSDGVPESAETLVKLGFGDDELSAIYKKYSSVNLPKSIWFAKIEHFSLFDLNFYLSSFDPIFNGPRDPFRDPNSSPDENNSCAAGSIILCESRILAQNLPIVGTDHSLVYRSDRQPGFLKDNEIHLDLKTSDEGLITSREAIVNIAGRVFHSSTSGEWDRDHKWKMIWDGNDIFGRKINGPVPAKILLRYGIERDYGVVNYVVWLSDPAYIRVFGEQVTTIYESVKSQVPEYYNIILTQMVGSNESNVSNLGGWNINNHHVKSKTSNDVLLGSGHTIQAKLNPSTIAVLNSGASRYYYSDPELGPDGNLYYISGRDSKIFKFNPKTKVTEQIYSLGQDSLTSPTDGSDARHVALNICRATSSNDDYLEIGPDGYLYYMECKGFSPWLQYKIRKINLDNHQISTVAGKFEPSITEQPSPFSTDGKNAKDVMLAGNIFDFEIATDGSIVLIQQFSHPTLSMLSVVKKIRTNGEFTTLLSDSEESDAIDINNSWYLDSIGNVNTNFPVRADKAKNLGIKDIELDNNNDLYFANYIKVFKFKDGLIDFYAGGKNSPQERKDGVPAKEYSFNGYRPFHRFGFDNLGIMYLATDRSIHIVDLSGTIYTVVGDINSSLSVMTEAFSGMNGTDLINSINYDLIYFDQNNDLNFGSSYNNQKYYNLKLSGSFQEIAASGSEYYIFDEKGLHTETRDQITGALIYQFNYSSENLLTSITDTFGNSTEIKRSGDGHIQSILAPFGQMTNITLNSDGFLSSIVHPDGSAYEMAYHQTNGVSNGLLASFTDPLVHKKEYTYDDLGMLNSAINSKGNAKTIISNSTLKEKRVTLVSPENRRTTFFSKYQEGESVPLEHIRSTNYPNGMIKDTVSHPRMYEKVSYRDSSSFTSFFNSDPIFGIDARYSFRTEINTNAGYSVNYYTRRTVDRDGAQNPYDFKSMTEELTINKDQNLKFTTTTNRESGTIVSMTPEGFESTTIYDKQTGLVASQQSSGLHPTRYEYDSQGRIVSIASGPSGCTSGPDCRLSLIEYFPDSVNGAGSVSKITNPLGEVIEFEKDKNLRVTKNTSNKGTAEELVKSFGYDASGNMTSITPPEKPAYKYFLDELDSVISFESPAISGGSNPDLITYEYDKDDMLTKTTFADGQSVNITYNTGGDIETVISPRNSYNYTYKPNGQLANIIDSNGVSTGTGYHGHLIGLLRQRGFPNNDSEYTVDFTPDSQLRVGNIAISGAGSYAYQYDKDSFLTGAGAISFTRDSQNGLLGTSQLASVNTSQTYTGFGEVDTFVANYGSGKLYENNYTYDKLGRIVGRTEFIEGSVSTSGYVYDKNGRLIEVTGAGAQTYSYDANGNRLNNIAIYDAQDRLLSDANYDYVYTDRGSLKERVNRSDSTKTTYDYDLFGNLLSINLPSTGLIEYVHDPRNRRIGKKVGGTLTHGFIYKDQLNPVAQFDQNGVITHEFVYGSKANVPDYMVYQGVNYRIISDERGSVRLVVNSNDGSIAQRIDYDVWGNVFLDTNPGFQPFGFAGGLYDPDTSLVRFGARDYDPSIGRWLDKDPIKFDGGFNFFAYAGNDPVNRIDRSGLYMEKIITGDLSKNSNRAVSVETFVNKVGDRTLDQVLMKEDGSISSATADVHPAYPRYVKHPHNSNVVIDMRHMLVVGQFGEEVGIGIEVLQYIQGYDESAFDPQDVHSNALGSKFFDDFDPSKPLGPQISDFLNGPGICE